MIHKKDSGIILQETVSSDFSPIQRYHLLMAASENNSTSPRYGVMKRIATRENILNLRRMSSEELSEPNVSPDDALVASIDSVSIWKK